MRCPNCEAENSDSAKFCKKCGTKLEKKEISHETLINSMNNTKSSDNTSKYIIVALVIIAIVLAGAFVYIYGFGTTNDNSEKVIDNSQQNINQSDDTLQATQTAQSSQPVSMSILGGSFSTDGGLEDKTYASIYVGPEYAGENVKIQIFYSRDGLSLNDGNVVPKTVDSDGYIDVASAEAFKYFPDFAEINLFDSSGNLMDSKNVNLNPESGTQSF